MEATKTVFDKYEAYKDSGETWLGEIPSEWVKIPNKYIFDLKKSQVGKRSHLYELLSLTLQGIIKRNLEDGGKFPAEFDTYQEVSKGDFVFCLFDVEETPRTVGLSDFDGMITGAYTVMKPRNGFHALYLFYFYLNLDSKKRLRFLYKGLRNTIQKESFFSLKSLIPPLPEQTAIAAFLDEKTRKIDQAIAQKERLIELLKERKQILIQELVTGKKVWDEATQSWVKPKETVDSGVEWIGEIPKGWEVMKVKHCTKTISKGTTPSTEGGEIIDSGPIRYLKAENIHDGAILDKPSYFIDQRTNNMIKRSELHIDDVLFVIAGATLGKTAVIDEKTFPANTNQAISFLRPNNRVKGNFLQKWLNTEIIRELTWLVAVQSAQPNLSMENLRNFPIVVPPKDYQTFLLNETGITQNKFNDSISLQQVQIKKLKEYKSVLIDSAVTGKIKVC